MQNHFELMYFNVQASPAALNSIVPAPLHAGVVTVITMLPTWEFIASTFTCPLTPAGNVAVSAPLVLK
jgi:hypothetical protein